MAMNGPFTRLVARNERDGYGNYVRSGYNYRRARANYRRVHFSADAAISENAPGFGNRVR